MNRAVRAGVACVALLALGLLPAAADDYILQQEAAMNAALSAGDYRGAERISQGMIDYAEKNLRNDHSMLFAAYSDAASANISLERYEVAVRHAERALAEARLAFAADSPVVAAPLTNLGNACLELGRLREAEQAHRRALVLRRSQHGLNSDPYADSLENLAATITTAGRYQEAVPLFDQVLALRISLHGSEHPRVGKTLFNMGFTAAAQSRDDDAEIALNQALRIFQRTLPADHPILSNVHEQVGRLLLRRRRLDEAEKHFQQALDITASRFGKENSFVQSGGSLSDLYVEQRRFAEAEPLRRKGVELARQGQNPPSYLAQALVRLGVVCVELGQRDEAEQHFSEAIDLLQRGEASAAKQFYAHFARALNRMEQKREDSALADLRVAVGHAERQRLQLSGSAANQAEEFARLRQGYELIGILELGRGRMAEALDAFERARARGLLDQMAAAHVDPLAGLPLDLATQLQGDLLAAERSVKLAERELDAMLAKVDPKSPDGQAQLAPLQAALAAARYRLVRADAALTNASPAYRQAMARQFKPAALDEVRQWCRRHETLLLYYVVEKAGSYLIYFDPSADVVRNVKLALADDQAKTLGVEPGELTLEKTMQLARTDLKDSLVSLLKNPGRGPAATKTLVERLAALWEVTVPAALRPLVAGGKAKRLAIVPGGGLAYLPFETLVTRHASGKDATYLVEQCPPTLYASSITLLISLFDRPPPREPYDRLPVLTVGDPEYDAAGSEPVALRRRAPLGAAEFERAGGKLKRLPGSGDESRAVAAAFQSQSIGVGQLLRQTATEASIRQNAPRRRVLHLACHGCSSSFYGNFFGALAVAQGPRAAADPRDDGFLTVAEIYPLDLRHCEIALLSACTTNVGPGDAGEGVWTISRAFLVAGSRRVVASLWEVSDEATATLMAQYCRAIAAGQTQNNVDYAAGLHAARRSLRQSPRTADPALWAPFVLIGPH